MQNTQVKDLMECEPMFISQDDSLQKAAEQMRKINCGVLPVGDDNNVEGMITDRDIVVRSVVAGKDTAKEKVRSCMTKHVYYCQETDTLKQAADKMRKHSVSRLIVKDKEGAVAGILSFGHIMRNNCNCEKNSEVVECAMGRKAA